jgi:hypothetical protein
LKNSDPGGLARNVRIHLGAPLNHCCAPGLSFSTISARSGREAFVRFRGQGDTRRL